MTRSRRHRALTLVELLAALALSGGAAAAMTGLAVSLASATGRSAAVGTLTSSLERARTAAEMRGGATLTGGGALTLHLDEPTAPAGLDALPRGWTAEFAALDGAPRDVLVFDALGAAEDALIVLRHEFRGNTARFRYRGVSGQLVETVTEHAP